MQRARDSLRLFAAVYPPPEVAGALLEALAGLPLPPHRVTRPEQVHLTVQFIGETARRDLRAAIESVERACAGLPVFALTAQALVTIPDHPATAPPRLVAARTDSPATLLELHRRLVQRFARPRRSGKPERFVPHLTLCRFPEGTPSTGGPWGGALNMDPFAVGEVRLMESRLTIGGGIYNELACVNLGR
ncbi:MAG: RNA 2',3'-cyclic phosphodiesterase [Phycisphaerales bacterium]